MKKPDSTLHDVAARVGVSTRTVSRVVNGEGGFSAATEAKVKAAIDELGYRPNLLARGLITKRTGTIGLIGGSMRDPFFPELAEGVQQAGQKLGLTLFFASSNDDYGQQQRAIDSLIGRAVDGIIVFPVKGDTKPIREIVSSGVKAVTVNPAKRDPLLNSISADIVGGAMLAVEHLRNQGRKRIVFLGNNSPYSSQREQGFRQALGSQIEPLIHEVEPTPEAAVVGVEAVLERWPDADAIFTYNDVMAMAAIRKLSSLGRLMPDEIAVVGFDNIGLSAYLNPPLTTIDLKQLTIGQRAVEMLDSMVKNADLPVQHIIQPVELVVRESSGAPRSTAVNHPHQTKT